MPDSTRLSPHRTDNEKPDDRDPCMPSVARPRRKRGKTAFQLHQKSAAVETQLARRENFFDLVDEAIRDRRNFRRRLAAYRKRQTGERPTIVSGELDTQKPLRRIGTWLAEATGFAGDIPQLPELIQAWLRDPEIVMLFIESCIATAADSKEIDALRRDQAFLEVHERVNRAALASGQALKGQRSGKVAADARGREYRAALTKHSPEVAQRLKRVSDFKIQKDANMLGLEAGVRLDDRAGTKPDTSTVRAVERALCRTSHR
jgi:hypothetical protein